MNLPTYEEIKPYVAKGYISEKSHPHNEDVKIFNYTAECQFDKVWDNVTLWCRGLIINTKTGEHLSRPFPKFFNLDEHFSLGFTLPDDEVPHVYKKLDGSLGILYVLDGVPMVATRGSFESEQAIWATNYFNQHYSQDASLRKAIEGKTYLFEIIYPENKIVIDYDFSGLVLLAISDIQTGDLLMPASSPFPTASQIEYESLSSLKKHNTANEEGYVLYYPKRGIHVKIKFDDYVRLHKVVTGLSKRGIWEMMVAYGPNITAKDMLQNVPDEFYKWMEDVIVDLRKSYNAIYVDSHEAVRGVAENQLEDRKAQALYITKHAKYTSVAFAMLDDKDYKSLIFKLIRPSAKTFKEDM